MARLPRLALGALLTPLLAAGLVSAPAASAAPATVRITVEGGERTLIPQREVTTTTTPLTRAGAACSGTSAAGALEVLTAGSWDAGYDTAQGLQVNTILGELHPATDDARRWVVDVNSVPTAVSPCELELNTGDTVLYYVSDIPAAQLAPTCRTNGRDGYCGSPDRTGPVGRVTAPKEQQVFSVARSPEVISGRVDADPSGISDIRLRITRTKGRKCHYYSGIEETFLKAKTCGATGPAFFSIAQKSSTWSYLMPRRFTPGRYTVDVQAVDGLGNPTLGAARGIDRIVFNVR